MTPKKISEVSKYMTVWFKTHTGSYSDFKEIPTAYAIYVMEKIEKTTAEDKVFDKEFGAGFSSYLRALIEEGEEPQELSKMASIDKFG
tara:strand:+ start:161 stop:424 length:264 start_codon:yes stop_codon:yes gene_type:complete